VNVDLSRLATYIGTDDPFDARLEMVAGFAVAFLSAETHRYLGSPEERTEYLPGTGTTRLWLSDTPTGEVTVEESRAGDPGEAVDDYITRGRSLLRAGGKQWDRRYDYGVTYTAGFVVLPQDLEQAVFDLSKWKLEYLGRDSGLGSEKLGDYSYTRAEVDGSGVSWLPHLNAAINRWKRNPI
jgi:hypothetical protein